MKLLQIGPYPPPLGGWSFHIKMFKEYLDSEGIENVVMNMGPNRKAKSDAYIDVQNLFDYIRKVLYYRKKGYLVYVHLNGDSVKGMVLTFIAQVASLFFFKRAVLSFHAGVIQVCFHRRFTFQKILAFFNFALTKGIMCNSEEVEERIAKFHISRKKIFAIPCFSKQYLNYQPKLTEDESAFMEVHHPIISCYLFFREEYEPATLIEAARLLLEEYPSFGLILIGSIIGSEIYLEKISAYGISEHICLAGDKSHDNFLTLIERSDLFVRTHMRDGVCSSVMEALALGIPVIACDNKTRPRDVILYESKNPSDMAKRMKNALSNLEELKNKISDLTSRDAMKEELDFLRNISL